MRHLAIFLLTMLFAASAARPLPAAHGASIDGQLKYPPDFARFDYTSDKATKGGHLILQGRGSFDKMNPFTLKGIAADGLGELVFESLTTPSLDEPFAAYGLIAKDIELAKDRLSITYTINEQARFSDGTPVTPQDVKFSLEILKSDKAHPFYQTYYQDISRAEVLDGRRVRFYFARVNRELHMIASQIPILSKRFYAGQDFTSPSMTPPIGSGPYVVDVVRPGKSISYKRNPDYWARDLNVRRHMFNFDAVTIKYFQDQTVALEAFKAHEFDFIDINVAKQWARDLSGPKFADKILIKESLPHQNNAGMQGFVMNRRRPLFADRRVRKALCLALDFEWTNQSLFFNQYTRSNSYFSNSHLAATGLPQGLELKYLLPFKGQLPQDVFTTPLTPFTTAPPQSLRSNLRRAKKLLAEAGWTIRNGRLVNRDGAPFEFEILLVSPWFQRVMGPYVKNLKKLGIKAATRKIDAALYVRRVERFDFDMIVHTFGQSQSPGNEQRDFWHSAVADREGSRNVIGIKDPVVDHLVDRIIYAKTQNELTSACRALDRVLWYGYYVVPNWYVGKHRVAYRNTFKRPATLPLYYSSFQALMTWWMKPAGARQ